MVLFLYHNINLVIDRLILKDGMDKRLNDSIEIALEQANGLVLIKAFDREYLYSTQHACTHCGISIGEIAPRLFSFNNPFGACPECNGLGVKMEIDKNKVVRDANLSINQGVVYLSGWNMEPRSISEMYMKGLAKKYNFSLDTPFKDLPNDIQEIILYGTKGEDVEFTYKRLNKEQKFVHPYEGIIPNLERRYRESNSESVKNDIGRLMVEHFCTVCNGKRLRPEALSVKIADRNIVELCDMSIVDMIKQVPQKVKHLFVIKAGKPDYFSKFKEKVLEFFKGIPIMEGTVSPVVGAHVGPSIGLAWVAE